MKPTTSFLTKAKAGLVVPLSESERQYIEKLLARVGGWRSIRAKQCYRNAQRLISVDEERRLRYCEGHLNGGIPHAWLMMNGKVVDPTAESVGRRLRRMGRPEDTERTYFGFVVNRRAVLWHILRTKDYGPVVAEQALMELFGDMSEE